MLCCVHRDKPADLLRNACSGAFTDIIEEERLCQNPLHTLARARLQGPLPAQGDIVGAGRSFERVMQAACCNSTCKLFPTQAPQFINDLLRNDVDTLQAAAYRLLKQK
jgi:hypothetical protein